jgi:hypothetical protein
LERLDPDIIRLHEDWTARAKKAAPLTGHWAVAHDARQHTFFQHSLLENAPGPSLQQLSGAAPFVTWDGLSTKPGAGETLDYIFVRGRSVSPTVSAPPRLAFTAPTLQQRLSDHLGIEALVNWGPWRSLAAGSEPLAQDYGGNHFEPFTNPDRVYVGRSSAMFGGNSK